MIIATAGHVDHGKTALVKALSGVDTDRLPEEKRRGLTIDLGFAYLGINDAQTIGFVDVPGHERFIHNMLCGVAGIDAVLFAVAADDGPMPQTREHLAILDLLEIRHGMVALTKIDRVTPERVTIVQNEIARLLTRTTLAKVSMFPVSSVTGAGLAELMQHLRQVALALPPRAPDGNFRLAVDRSFTLSGAGLVVTGTAVSGQIVAGDTVQVLLADVRARVRAIHAQNAQSSEGRAGQRCALNLAGSAIRATQIVRGDWIVKGDVPPAVRRIDGRLRVVAAERQPLEHWTPVHVHLGASNVTGRIAMLEGPGIAPGALGLVQLVLDRPIGALHGDRFIVRDQSATRTIGGGRVIDVFPPSRGRARPERIAYLQAMEPTDPSSALDALLRTASSGVDLTLFARNRNLTTGQLTSVFSTIPIKRIGLAGQPLGFLPAHWERQREAVLSAVAAWHRRLPESAGPPEHGVLEGTDVKLPRAVVVSIVTELLREGALVKNEIGVQLPSHRASLSLADERLWIKVSALLEAAALQLPSACEIALRLDEGVKPVQALLERLARAGQLSRISHNRFLLPRQTARLADMVQELAEKNDCGQVTAAVFRDYSGLGRNRSIEVLEYFDRIKFTRRIGDAHVLFVPARDVLVDRRRERTI